MFRAILAGIFFFSLSALAFAGMQNFVNITIQGVTCPFCIKVLITNLKKVPEVEQVDISQDDQHLVVAMAPGKKPDITRLTQTILKSGYLSLKTETSALQSTAVEKNHKVLAAHMDLKNQDCNSCHTSGK